jgi:hypothetical protein
MSRSRNKELVCFVSGGNGFIPTTFFAEFPVNSYNIYRVTSKEILGKSPFTCALPNYMNYFGILVLKREQSIAFYYPCNTIAGQKIEVKYSINQSIEGSVDWIQDKPGLVRKMLLPLCLEWNKVHLSNLVDMNRMVEKRVR